MTVTIVLSDCPPKLRGDMTKWFLEISTGVYVGTISARLRDELWNRIIQNIGHGHATMIFSTSGEQHFDFRVHNAYWQPVDCDGIKLMRRPANMNNPGQSEGLKSGFSKATKQRMSHPNEKTGKILAKFLVDDYAVLDFETTGLNEKTDRIIEIGLLVVIRGKVVDEKQMLVKTDAPLSQEIIRLTGITDNDLQKSGVPLENAIADLIETVEDLPIVCHHAVFEQGFINEACRLLDETPIENRFIDTMQMAQIMLPELQSYRLSSLAGYLGFSESVVHRALPDCRTAYGVYCKLKELASSP